MPILEEISDAEDIDNLDMDLAEFDPNLKTPFAPKLEKKIVRSQDSEDEPPLFPNMMNKFMNGPAPGEPQEEEQMMFKNQKKFSDDELETLKTLQLIYPCYFDKNRSIKQGRRVGLELAVENPLAKTIADACSQYHLIVVYEPDKTHPQDYGNPGRVRVALKHDGKPESVLFSNKRELFKKIGEYLKKHETTLQSIKELPAPPDFKNVEPKEIPKVKGFKMNTIVPMFSKFQLEHPFTKSIYETPAPGAAAAAAGAKADGKQGVPKQKNKFLHVRR